MNASGEKTGWEALFWLVFERSAHPIVLLDENRRIIAANDAAVTLWGGRREELDGRSIVDSIEPSERAQAEQEWEAFLRSGEYSGVRDLLRADGRTVRVSFAARRAFVGGRQVAAYVAVKEDEDKADGGREKLELPLTEREREVVTLIALGYETDQIAAELHISPETVRSHVRNAMSRLHAHTRAQLVAVTLCAERTLDEDCLLSRQKFSA